MHATDLDRVVDVVVNALPVRGTVAAVRHIHGGLAVRVTGRTNRILASHALRDAGFPVACDEVHGTLHIPAARRATR